LQLQESPNCNCNNCNIFNICSFCADLQLRVLQHFWQITAYIQGLWHRVAILPLPQLPPFVPIRPSGMDDLDDVSDDSQDSHILILITFLIAAALSIPSG
jgi:hypothetical protein